MRYLKRFNENKDVFMEYILEFTEDGKPEELFNNRLSKLLRFIRMEGIKNYTIKGITKSGDTKIVLKIGK
jgi:hypothetical protein